MTAGEAAEDPVLVKSIADVADVRPAGVVRVLLGLEVWPETYRAVRRVALESGVTDIPDEAPRASRKSTKPCPECARLRTHLVEQMQDWKRQWSEVCNERDAARARIVELEAALEAVRAQGGAPAREVSEAPPAPTMQPAPPVLPLPCRPRAPDSVTVALTAAVAKVAPASKPRLHLFLKERDGAEVEVPMAGVES